MTSKLLEANSIPIPPQLAGLLKQALGRSGTGFDEGAFLQQLHYWSLNAGTIGHVIDGVKWIYNSLKDWREQFPWMSEYGLRKAINNLKKLGLVHTAQHWIGKFRRVMFYRIDYEKLETFCNLVAPRCAEGDGPSGPVFDHRADVMTDRGSVTDTTAETSLSEQQQAVVSEENNSCSGSSSLEHPACREVAPEDGFGMAAAGEGNFPGASSGDILGPEAEEFPELMGAVMRAIALPPGATLPASLRGVIKTASSQANAQYPERVMEAIDYLNYQRQRRHIHNPVGYLYEAIASGWNISIPGSGTSRLPAGFSKWFSVAKAQGRVLAATMIDRVHHTLHVELGWLPTEQVMRMVV